jgi:formate hydrogenlyase transcriptional activator
LTINDLGQPLAESFINAEPALVNDITSNNTISAPFRKWLAGRKVEALFALPLRNGSQTFGVLLVSSIDGLLLTEDEMLAYRSLAEQISTLLQNARLFQESQVNTAEQGQQVEVLQRINQLATSLSAVQVENDLFGQSAEMLVNTVKVNHCGIVLVDAGEETGTVVAEYPAGSALGLKIPWVGNPLAGLVTQEGKTAILHDTGSDERLIEASRQFFASAGITGCIFVPLKIQGRVVGSVGLDIYHRSHSISPEMVEIAEIMTTQIGIALQNIRLLTDTQRHAQQLQRIASFNQSVQATLDMESIFNIALTESAQMLPLDQMRILLYDPAQAQLRTVAENQQGQIKITLTDGAPLALGETTEGHVWRTREFVYLPAESRARDPRQPFKMEPGSDMIAPLQSHGRTLGVVAVSINQSYAYGETDFAVFRQMADQLTVAIENAEAYTQSQRQAHNEALVNEIATRLQRQTDIQNMLDITMNELGKALGARRARIRLATQPGDSLEKSV